MQITNIKSINEGMKTNTMNTRQGILIINEADERTNNIFDI